MITFVDGPAAGVSLSLQRTPMLLRVVTEACGAVDALDQLDDEPRPGESICVYQIVGLPRRGIACSRGKGCRPFVVAEYRLCSDQPIGDEARDGWPEWAEQQAAKL